MKDLLARFSKIGSDNRMVLTSQEVLNRIVFGVDGIQRKVFIVRAENGNHFSDTIVDLKDVKACSVKKEFGNISAGSLRNNQLNDHLLSLSLQFEMDKSHVEIPFFSSREDQLKSLPELEKKAMNWKTILSKMLKVPKNSKLKKQLDHEKN